MIPEEAGDIGFQDFAFKLNFPTKNAGNFTLWGLGARDDQDRNPIDDETEWETRADKQGYENDQSTPFWFVV